MPAIAVVAAARSTSPHPRLADRTKTIAAQPNLMHPARPQRAACHTSSIYTEAYIRA